MCCFSITRNHRNNHCFLCIITIEVLIRNKCYSKSIFIILCIVRMCSVAWLAFHTETRVTASNHLITAEHNVVTLKQRFPQQLVGIPQGKRFSVCGFTALVCLRACMNEFGVHHVCTSDATGVSSTRERASWSRGDAHSQFPADTNL